MATKKIRNPKIFTPQFSLLNSPGFTLIEIAMMIVIIGIFFGLGANLMRPLVKRAKFTESREVVKAAKQTVMGYVVKNGYLPAELETAGARKLDAWGRNILFYSATEFDASDEDACGTSTTGIQVYECTVDDCSSYNTKSNVGFIIYSEGQDADGAGTGTASPFRVRIQDSSYTDSGTTYNYDDTVYYVSLDEIRSAKDCGQPVVITSSNTLSDGEEDSFYSYEMQASGGVPPYTWGDGTLWGNSDLSLNDSGLISGTLNFYDSSPNTGDLINCSETITIDASELKVTDSAGASDTSSSDFTITVNPEPLDIIIQSLPAAYEGQSYSATIFATGGKTAYSWSMSVSDSCPSGLDCGVAVSNIISGTPASGSVGVYSVTITANASESGDCTASKVLALNIFD